MNRITALTYSLFSGILLSAAWPVAGFFPIIFFAWLPLLYVEDEICNNYQTKGSFFTYSLIAMLAWNLLTTWWVKNASLGGAVMAIVANSLLMTLVLTFFHWVKLKKGNKYGYAAFIAFWMTFEYIHLRWDITWPWLNLGNCFAGNIKIIQWYEFTGTFGGTLWVLVVNILLFRLIKNYRNKLPIKKLAVIIGLTLFIPILISLLVYYSYNEKYAPLKAVIVQPNIDPYNEKFSNLSSEEQLQKLLSLAIKKLDTETNFLIAPETAIVDYLWENKIHESPDIKMLDSLIKIYPQLNVLIGASTLQTFGPGQAISLTARKFYDSNEYYDSYNTALQLNHTPNIQIYHKSKLVPGVEKMPWPSVFKYFEKFAIDLGGISGSLGTQEEREAFFTTDKKFAAAPIICYESVYGEYVGEYIKKGANFLAIITNDGWWGDTPGYKQHLEYGSLRAIETRRSILRSANTGISAVINQRGEIVQKTNWWIEDALTTTINTNQKITFYTRFGDYLGVIAIMFSIVVIISTLGFNTKFKAK
ncbi:MAG: apolipoprotein N-acyltransferase [Bacteroidia bacterium]|nr:apolipoprotein N-acyltransferase [Bacteroidia bacterium]MCZ2247562.1 apolipoprotein N-acyltransferase [Bacteroidia bacterium]